MALIQSRRPVTAQTIARRAQLPLYIIEERLQHMEMLALVTKASRTAWQKNKAWKPGPISVDTSETT